MSRGGSVLLVDDERKIREALRRALEAEGYAVVTAAGGREAREQLAARLFDVVVLDNVMPDVTGLELVRELAGAAAGERPQVVMMTAHGTVESAIEAMKLGALDYLLKPFDVDELLVVVARAVEHQRLRTQHRYLVGEREEDFGHYGIVTRDPRMQEVIRQAEMVAATKSTVLILGETGTGKELLARAIHARSAQREMPLIKVNCAAIPETLIESELFGHVKGAFTGAVASKKGKFALADGGSVFLDEIGTLSPSVQAKLLRVLQEREFEPVGAEATQTVDVRVIAATNRDLAQMVAEGRFLEDLFYRLNVIPLVLPPLRERRSDVEPLAQHFLRKHALRTGKAVERLDDDALLALAAYDWPGNVRELENAIERAVVLAAGPVITVTAVAGPRALAASGLPSLALHQNLEWAEKESIRRALQQAGGVKKDAAALMGISQRALSHYLAKHRLPD